MSSRPSIALSLLALCPVAALLTASCNVSHCESLRDELFADKQTWQACETDVDCVIVGGNNKDCTGILSCNLSINRAYRSEAERRIASLPEETVDCVECQSPNCPEGSIALCELKAKQCIIVQDIIQPAPAASFEVPDASEGSVEPMGGGGSP